ncbi:FAD-binding oxidoreductase [Insolitispirillum peregrinum]|uniref:NAD(P)H-flavin reductase n=1 Tax=Insolitispirillum peregrinum TaxID=80876 RepID=A0A1N7IZK9_9PROT|nr:FAD-binding oxidoreductase [Insolitispirillum peregrinum]SIS42436.1 NAD(P)H-flavin reductase [Insolitispirillum peregrinum]
MSVHAITLTTADVQTFSFDCDEAESLLDAAARRGLTLPSSCRQGACGACLATVQQGEFHRASINEKALPQGGDTTPILLCSTYPRGEMALTVTAQSAQITSGPVPVRSAMVVANDDIGGAVHRLVLDLVADPVDGLGAPFEAGQFMELEVPGTQQWRAYSLSNAPNWDGRLEFLIRLHPDGLCSQWLKTRAAVGETLRVRGPQGAMVLASDSLRPRCFIAGGTGLAPLLSMARQMAEFGDSQPCHLYFGVTRQQDLFALAELDALTAQLPSLQVTVCLWEASEGWQGATGSPVDAWARDMEAGTVRSPDVYVCGPAGLIDAVEKTAQQVGIPTKQVFSERFLPSS